MKQAQASAPKLRTPAEAKAELERQGISIAEFARIHQLQYSVTYQVLTGEKKGKRGMAHRAAVLLGLKDGVVLPAPEQQS